MSEGLTREQAESLEALRVQSKGSGSLAAHQAYINGLEFHLATLRAQLAQVTEKLKQSVYQTEGAESDLYTVQRQLAAMTAERDLAIAHDRQPYPTAHAYEQVCKALESHKRKLAEREAWIRELEARVSPDTSSTPHADAPLPPDCRNVP